MNAPFRDLFVELPRQLFETLQGIGEQAVRNAQAPKPRQRPSVASTFISATNNAFLGDWLCERFGWKRVEVWRDARNCDVVFMVKHHCGHVYEFPISEFSLETTPTIQIADLIASVYAREGRGCYCVQRYT